ncbi:MAG: hypothetical protein ACREDR_30575, partial [Blastocatellia bacterium]
MSWSGRVFDRYEPSSAFAPRSDSLPAKVSALIQQQIESWPALNSGIEALVRIEANRIAIDGT